MDALGHKKVLLLCARFLLISHTSDDASPWSLEYNLSSHLVKINTNMHDIVHVKMWSSHTPSVLLSSSPTLSCSSPLSACGSSSVSFSSLPASLVMMSSLCKLHRSISHWTVIKSCCYYCNC